MEEKITLELVKKDIERYFNIEDIGIKSRERNLVMYRRLYYTISRKYTSESLANIGINVNRDHSSVINGLNKYNELILYFNNVSDCYKLLKEKYNSIKLKHNKIDIEIRFCDLLNNKILTRKQIELQLN